MSTTSAPKFSSSRAALLSMIEAYLARNPSMSAESFGWAAISDSKLVARLRNGGDITTAKMDQIVKFMGHPTK